MSNQWPGAKEQLKREPSSEAGSEMLRESPSVAAGSLAILNAVALLGHGSIIGSVLGARVGWSGVLGQVMLGTCIPPPRPRSWSRSVWGPGALGASRRCSGPARLFEGDLEETGTA